MSEDSDGIQQPKPLESNDEELARVKSESLYRIFFDNAADAIAVHDMGGKFLEVNRVLCERLGYSREELLQMTPADISSPEHAAIFQQRVETLRKSGNAFFETVHVRRNGTTIPIEASTRLIEYKGKPAVLSFTRDITERKKAEEALRESEERYRLLFEKSPVGIGLASVDGRIVSANEIMQAITGYSAEELREIRLADTYENPADREKLLETLRRDGAVVNHPARLKRKDGTPYHALLSVSRISIAGKGLLQTTCIDITERKRAENALRQQYSMLDGIINSSDAPIFSVDRQYRYTSFNKAHAAVMKVIYGKDIEIGKSLLNYMTVAEDREEAKRNLDRALAGEHSTEEAYSGEETRSRLNFEVSHSPIMEKDGAIIGVAVFARDITERKRTAEKLDAIHKHSVQLGAENSIDEIVTSTLDAMEDTLGFHYAGFEEVKDGFAQIKEARGIPASLEPLPLDGPGIVVKVARTKETIRISDTRSEPAFVDTMTKSPDGQPVRMLSELAVPVIVNGSVVAVLNAESTQLGAFNESDQVLLGTLAMHVSSAIARLEQMEALRSRAEELGTLQATVLDITAPYDLSTLLERIVERAVRLLGAKSGGMYLCDPEKREARCVVSYNTPHDYRGVVLKYGEGAAGRVAEAGRPLMVNDYRLWEGRAEVYEKDRPFSALLGAPMIWQDRVIGIIHVMEESKVRRFTQADLEMLMLFANHATIAVKRTRTEQELKESEERYRMMFRSMGDAVAVYEAVDQGNVFVFRDFNEAAERIEKAKSEDVIGRRVLEVFPGLKDLGLFEVFQRVWKTGKPEHLPAGIYKDKRIVGWRENYVYKLPSGELVAVYQDITDRKRLEEELRQYSLHLEKLVNERAKELRSARERLEYMITSNPAVIYAGKPLADRSDFVLTYVSDRVVAMLGFEAREFIGHPEFWQHRVHLEDLRSVLAEMPRLWKEGQYSFDYRFLHKDGAYRWIREEAKVVRDADGKPIEVNGYWTDITERKHLEEALAKSQRLAAIGETSAMVGHDLRNPLQGIAGVVYLAKRNLESRKATDRRDAAGMLDTIQEQITYMDKIVSDLQDYAQPLTPKLTETNLPNLIRQTLSTVRIPKAVKVSVEVEKAAQNVMIDPTLMRRTFTNLAINAIQAMPKRGKLTVRARSKGNSTVMTVEDTGEGIPKKNLTKLFSPFFTTKAKGQGLGLAVCKRLVEAQGGTITVKSKPRKGTAFTIKMPRGKREVAS